MLIILKVPTVLGTVLTKKLFLGFLSSVFILGSISHSVASEVPLTLNQALKRTLDFNPSLKIYDVKTQVLQGHLATARLNPSYQLGLDLDNVVGSGDFNGLSRSELTISLSSVIELGDKPASRTQVVESRQSFLHVQKQAESLALLGLTTRRYIDVLSAQALLELAEEKLTLAKSAYILVTKRVKAGATPDLEAKRAHTAIVRAELSYSAELQKLVFAKVALANSWGATEVNFDFVEGSLYQFSQDVSFESLYAKVKSNPMILLLAAEQRVKASEYRLAQVRSKLDIDWQIGFRRFEESSDVALVAGLSIPLYKDNRQVGLIQSAKAEVEQIKMQKELALLPLYLQLYSAYSHRQQALLTVKQFQEVVVPELKQVLDETQLAYQNGLYGYLEYITSRHELLSAKKTLIESAAAGLKYGLEIEQLIAEPLSVLDESENKMTGKINYEK
ncbi:MAG: outer membrane protein, heavy metal efflux system [Thiomicrorhabdus sp.]|nr:MAG: outer membrane protein, heavy metal efflux system [Thiomicrorhabdus sp.]